MCAHFNQYEFWLLMQDRVRLTILSMYQLYASRRVCATFEIQILRGWGNEFIRFQLITLDNIYVCFVLFTWLNLNSIVPLRGLHTKRAALFSSIFHLTNTNIHKSEYMLTHIPRTVTIPYPYGFRLSNTIPSIQISDFHFKSLLPSRWISFTCVQMFERIIFRNVSVIRLFFCIPFCCACMWVSGVLYTS